MQATDGMVTKKAAASTAIILLDIPSTETVIPAVRASIIIEIAPITIGS